jgi:hypothetical protein
MVHLQMKKVPVDVLPVFIGYDSREPEAYEVAKASILKHATMPVHIQKLNERALRHSTLYRRTWHAEGNQKVDDIDGKPFSTEFSFSRFLVPALCQWEGWAVFMDCDQLFKADIAKLLHEADPKKAIQVCKQRYIPNDGLKMDGMRQEKYFRKNWSSFMLWNCAHATNRMLTTDAVNCEPGSWLHGLGWCPDDEIGDLNHGWNWIDGTSKVEPLNVHYTLGGPWFPHMRDSNAPYFEDWRNMAKEIGIWRHMCERQDRELDAA